MIWYQAEAIYKEAKKKVSYIPKRFQKFAKIQSEEAEKLNKHAPWDHAIELEEGTSPRFFPIYKIINKEVKALKEFVQEQLRKGYIRPLQSSAGYPVLFMPKKNGKLRTYIDY